MTRSTEAAAPRISWVDAARALGICAIVYSHAVYGEGPLAQVCYAFHVPLFCFCAGFVFHGEDVPFAAFAGKRARTVLWPWLLFSLISIALYAVGARSVMAVLGDVKDPSPVHALTEMLRGYCYANSPLWFLPCFFLQQLLLRLLTAIPLCRRHPAAFSAGAGAVFAGAACAYLSFPHGQLPWAADTALILLPFAFLGYGLRHSGRTLPGPARLPAALALTAAGTGLSLAVNSKVNYWDNAYGNPLLFYLAAGLILLGLWAGLSAVSRWPAAVLRTGRESQGILLMHKFPVLFFQAFVPFTVQPLRDQRFLPALAVTLVSAGLCVLVCALLRSWLPWALGEKRRRGGAASASP